MLCLVVAMAIGLLDAITAAIAIAAENSSSLFGYSRLARKTISYYIQDAYLVVSAILY